MAEDFRRLVLNRYCRCISAEVKMAYLPKRAALKMPYSTARARMALHVGSRLFIEAGGKVFVEKLVGTHVIAFVGINAGEGAQQNGKGAVTLTFHDAAHQTVVHEVCVQGE